VLPFELVAVNSNRRILSMKAFSALALREILAVAVSSEEDDARIYMTFADDLRER
jgi:hypothetical protein